MDMAIAQKRSDLMAQLHPQSKVMTNTTNTVTLAENETKGFSRSNSMSRGSRKASVSNMTSRRNSSSRSSRDERKKRTASGGTSAAMMQKQQSYNESKLNELNALHL